MAPHSPVTLVGDTLGQRHRHLNSLVRAARESGTTVQDVEAVPEQAPADRLFKVDLAVSLGDADYILRNLKHDDMLFVSRALKARWLLDRHDVINPQYLEDTLFPEMVSPAVSKMRHWLYINLREPAKCQEFYEYYKQNSFEFAIKFLSRCSNRFILEEVPKILAKLSPHYLKVLCEKCSTVAKIYFDSLATQDDVKKCYLDQEQAYYNSIKCVLKSDADVFLDITEKYFSFDKFKRFSPLATDYIVRCHKSRVTNKLELYVAHILHIPTLAARLSVDECQEVVLQLARASYLQHWFQYKAVEPLIKRLHPQKRAAFKKRVFVDKDVGELVQEWPYETPSSPAAELDSDSHVFDDAELECVSVLDCEPRCGFAGGRLLKRSYRNVEFAECLMRCGDEYDDCMVVKVKTDLDRLFDEFRFIGFDHALQDLSHRVGQTGSTDRRRDIFLVLVSKSGGRTEAVTALLELAVRHSNEPAHTRASVIRSLVKRAAVWRLPADVWQLLLDFSHGLGLDGATPEAPCREGLHAVVIRQLLAGQCDPIIRDAFLKDFSTLAEYSLKPNERKRVADNLQNMLASAAVGVEPKVAADLLNKLLDVLKVYRIRVEASSLAVKTVTALAVQDKELARPLLERLYNARIARRELLRLNMMFRRDEQALLNALRHDPLALDVTQVVDILTDRRRDFDIFTAKLAVYFVQKQDFTPKLRNALKEKISKPLDKKSAHVKLARPLASILSQEFITELKKLDQAGKEYVMLQAQLRACAHRARPIVNLAEWGWSRAGVKAVATHVMRCREIERAEFIRTLAAERRTVRVALALSLRSKEGPVLDTFTSFAKLRPAAALRAGLQYFHRRGDTAELGVWDIIKPLLSTVDLKRHKQLRQVLANTDWIPNPIKPAYITELYSAVHTISRSHADRLLQDLCKILPECDESIENVLLHTFDSTNEKQNLSGSNSNSDSDDSNIADTDILYPALYIRYLMLAKSNEDLEKRYSKIGIRFIKQLEILRSKKDKKFKTSLDQVLASLRYNAAFFDTKYLSCLLVIQKILDWLQTFLPKEKYFQIYVQIHLTMLYFKAVRQSMKQLPEVFADPKRKRTEGVEAVGFVFGRYIAKEVSELVTTYFDSIIELYTAALVGYLESFQYGVSRDKFIGHALKGFLVDGVGLQRRLAVYTYRRFRYDVTKDMLKEIEELLSKDKAIEMFVHAEICD
ncbi:uncharacterized protein LOC118276642 [Spodoptera frugiperda]|uniref:Uncharacterized protein LOC118276642 n=1 Tax=Spodoptera frugiperda TaxID=7108 RepID=A0A9R0DYB3_SPOFR|nr:uncharacterized protein LOC118276642 [Spodoptera frugiperda]XP_050555877.1 uncharacterized protein LOC118276642 [Spodoptera frugiperda]